MSTLSRVLSIFSRLAPLALLPAELAAQAVRINGPLPQPGASDVDPDYAFAPSGARMVFRANLPDTSVHELYSATSDASAPALRLAPGIHVTSFVLGLGRAVYIADGDGDASADLYTVSLTGSAPVLLSGGVAANRVVTSVQLTPDSTRAVFIASSELFSVPVDGSAPAIALDSTSVAGAVRAAWISPDGTTVAFANPFFQNERLYSVPIDGSALPVEIAEMPADYFEAIVGSVRFTPDGQYVVFTALEIIEDETDIVATRLGTVPVDGSSPAVILAESGMSPPPSAIGAGGRILFNVGQVLYSSTPDGSQTVQIGQLGNFTNGFVLTPDGATVVFGGTQGTLKRAPVDDAQPPTVLLGPGSTSFLPVLFASAELVVFYAGSTLQSLDIDGGTPATIALMPSSKVRVMPDGQNVVFVGFTTPSVFELFAAPTDGIANPHRISATMSSTADVLSFAVPSVGQRVAYLADQREDGTVELFAAFLDGHVPPAAYVDVPAGPIVGDVTAFRVTPDGKDVVYLADETVDQVPTLYDTSARGLRTPAPLLLTEQTSEFELSPGGAYTLSKRTSGQLFASRRTGSPQASQLDSTVGPQYVATPDETRAVYLRGLTGQYELRSRPLDGSLPAVRLSTLGLFTDLAVTDFAVAPDSQYAVYRADTDSGGRFEIWRAPIDGSSAAVKLNVPLSGGQDVDTYRITADSSQVVYAADETTDNVQELYAVDLALNRRKLNGTLVTNGNVTGFVLTSDGTHAIYRADQVVDLRHELFAVDLLAAVPAPVPLTPLAGTQAVQLDFAVDASGTNVVYRADANTPGVLELFTVPLDASAAPVQISAPLVAGGDVASFALSPDGQRVVYLADQNADEVFELFSVGTLGGPVAALDPMPAFADVDVFRIASDSRSVVWRADRDADGVLELFGAPLDGSAPAVRLNDPLPAGADVESDFAALAGGRVLFRADQEQDEVLELFFARLGIGGQVLLGPTGPLPQRSR